ncbi:MAG: hypothetical protein WD294_05000 [Phycisphaeraceae bacterium]
MSAFAFADEARAEARFFDRRDGEFWKLVNAGRDAEAAALVARRLELVIPAWSRQQRTGEPTVLNSLIFRPTDAAEEMDLLDEVVKQARPTGEAANDPDAMLTFAFVCELLKQWHDAESAHRELVTLEPDDPSHRVRLALSLAHRDPAAAAEELLAVRSDDWPTHGTDILTHIQWHLHREYAYTLNIIEMADHWLAKRDRTHHQYVAWVGQLLRPLYMSPHPNLPSFLAKEREAGRQEQQLQERRMAIFSRLTEHMMDDPALSFLGFEFRVVLADRNGEDLTAYVPKARQILGRFADDPGDVVRNYELQETRFLDDRGWTDLIALDPAQFLIRHAWRTNNRVLMEEVIAGVTVTGDLHDEPHRTKAYAELYFATEENFVRAGQDYMDLFVAQHQRHHGDETGSPCVAITSAAAQHIVHAWRTRRLEVDINDLAIAPVADLFEGAGLVPCGLPEYLDAYALELSERFGVQATRELSRKISVVLMGTLTGQPDFVERYADAEDGDFNRGRIEVYVKFLRRQMTQTAPLMLLALEEFNRIGAFPRNVPHPRNTYRSLVGGSDDPDLELAARHGLDVDDEAAVRHTELIAFIATSRLTAEAEDFTPYLIGSEETAESVLGGLYHNVHVPKMAGPHGRDAKQTVRDWLAKEPDPSFGHGLLTAMFSDRYGAGAYDYLANNTDALDRMSEKQRDALAISALAWEGELEGISEAGAAVRERLLRRRDHVWEAELEQLLALERTERGYYGSRMGESLVPMLRHWVRWDPAKAQQGLDHALDLMHNTYYGNGSNDIGLLKSIVDAEDAKLRLLVAQTVRDRRDPPVEADAHIAGARLMPLENGTAPLVDHVEPALRNLASMIENDADVTFAMLGLATRPNLHSHRELGSIAAWAELEGNSIVPRIKRRLGQYATLLRATVEPELLGTPAHAAAVGALRAVLEDQTLSPTYRLAIAVAIVDKVSVPKINAATAELLSEMMADAETPVEDRQLIAVIEQILLAPGSDQAEAWLDQVGKILEGHDLRTASRREPPVLRGPIAALREAYEARAASAGMLAELKAEHGLKAASWLMLLLQGEGAVAAELLVEFAEEADLSYPRTLRYDATLATSAYQMFEAIDDPALRFFAEIVVSAVPDAEGYEGSPRAQRLAPLVARFAILDDRPPLRRQALLLMADHDEALFALAGVLDELVGDQDHVAMFLPADNVVASDEAYELVLRHLHAEVLQGNLTPFVTLMQAVSSARTPRERGLAGRWERPLRNMLTETIFNNLSVLSIDSLAELRPLIKQMLNDDSHDGAPTADPLSILSALTRAAAGEEPRDNPLTNHPHFREQVWHQLAEKLEDLLLRPERVPIRQRLEFLGRLLADAYGQKALSQPPMALYLLLDTDLVGRFDMLDHGKIIADLAPRGGRTWAELALVHHELGEGQDAYFQKAIGMVKQSENFYDTLSVAVVLGYAGEIARAVDLLESFEASSPQKQQQLTRVIEMMKTGTMPRYVSRPPASPRRQRTPSRPRGLR